jgi:S1-C subfamily serine protease
VTLGHSPLEGRFEDKDMGQNEAAPICNVRAGYFSRGVRLVALAAVVFLLWLSGCAFWPQGGEVRSGAVYVHGDHSRFHEGGYERVWMEALRAVSAMGLDVIRMDIDDLGGTITARRRDDTSIRLQVNPAGVNTTTVKIRVGTSGDLEFSERIQAKISRGLRDMVEIGTGFVVKPDGLLLTAWHLLQDAQSITVICPDQPPQSANPRETSRINDLAVIQIPLSGLPYLSLAEAGSLRVGDPVFTIGFPLADILGPDPKFTDGAVSALSGHGGETALMQVTVPIQPGNSGGPVLTYEGEVVGVVTSSAAVRAFLAVTGTVPQNLNWAVKAENALPLFEQPPAQPPAHSRRAAIDRGLKATCMIEAHR